MIVLTGGDVLAARGNAQRRDVVRVTAEELLLAGLDVPYDHLVAHRIEEVLLIRMQTQSVLRYACIIDRYNKQVYNCAYKILGRGKANTQCRSS